MHVANAEVAFAHTLNRQILAKTAGPELLAMLRKFLGPGGVMLVRISIDCLFRATMNRQIRLFVTVKSQRSDFHEPFDAVLAKSARHSFRSERGCSSNLN